MVNILDNSYIKSKNNVLEVIDINGSIIEASISDFTDFTTENNKNFSIQDNESTIHGVANIIVKDNDGTVIEISDSELIDAVKGDDVVAIDVTIEATHSADNLNNAIYTSSSLEKDCKTWLYPYKKPFIKNHNMDSEAIGRVEDAYFSQSEIDSNRDCINLVLRVSDKDSMIKFADKRYATVSVSGSPKSIQCNICGKDIVKDGNVKFCGHWKGNTYAGKKSQWIMTDISYKECSVVNSPADVYAQVKQIRLIKKGEKNMGNVKTPADNNVTADDNNVSLMDNLLNGSNDTNVSDSNNATGEVNVDNTTDENVSKDSKEVEDLKQEVETYKNKTVELEQQNKSLSDSLKEVKEELEEVKTLRDANLDTAKKMAAANKELMIQNLVLLKPDLKDSDALELKSKTAKELNKEIEDAKEARGNVTNVKQVVSSASAINDNHTVVESTAVENKKISSTDNNKNYLDIF